MAKIVNVEVAVTSKVFPAGTVDTSFKFVVTKDGALIDSKESTDTFAQFTVEAGNYVVEVTKNGVSASASFSVASEEVTLNVPATVTVSLV